MAEYLQRKGNTWRVSVEIPKALRAAAGGKPRFIKSLGTTSRTEANRLKHVYIAEFKRRIAMLEKGRADPIAELVAKAIEYRIAFDSLDNQLLEAGDISSDAASELLSVVNEETKEILASHGPEAARLFDRVASGKGTLISDHYPTWIAEADITEQTRRQHTSTLKRYQEWAGEYVTIEETTRLKAGQFVSHQLEKSGLTHKTIKRHLSSLSSFWNWLESRGIAQDNPWLRHRLGKKPTAATRKALPDELLLKLLNGSYRTAEYRQILHDLLRLGLLTGARLDELCALKDADVTKREDGYWLTVTAGKTESAVRDIPVHELGVGIVKRRLKDKDENLFKGLMEGGANKKRSAYVTKAYGRFRKAVGVDGPWQDFHSLRNTFMSMMEGVGAPESTVKLLVGHKRASMTYGHYSKGERVGLREVIEMLDYGPEVMKALAQ